MIKRFFEIKDKGVFTIQLGCNLLITSVKPIWENDTFVKNEFDFIATDDGLLNDFNKFLNHYDLNMENLSLNEIKLVMIAFKEGAQ
jgi:hypothetical protein